MSPDAPVLDAFARFMTRISVGSHASCVAHTISVHHGALAYLLGINALRASEAAAVRIEDYAETLRGHRVLHLVGKGDKPATMPLTVPVLRVLEACRGERTTGRLILRPMSGNPIDRRD